MFHYQVVIWECNCTQWHEIHGCQPRRLESVIPDSVRLVSTSLRSLPNLNTIEKILMSFFHLVNEYNHRQLTFPEDGLRAFSGVTAALNRVNYSAGFLWGMPRGLFSHALLWMAGEPLRRRQPRNPSGDVMPSWSWVGWQGRFEEEAWILYYFDEWNQQVQSAVAFHEPECEWAWQDKDGAMHPLHEGDGDHGLSQPSRWLRAMAEVGIMTVAEQVVENEYAQGNFRHLRRVMGSELVGILVADSPTEDFNSGLGFEVRLVVISRSRGKMTAGLSATRNDFLDDVCDYYDALWVDKDGDGVCRKGIARIMWSAWNEVTTRSFEELVLG